MVRRGNTFGIERGWFCKEYLDLEASYPEKLFWWNKDDKHFKECFSSDLKKVKKIFHCLKNPEPQPKIVPYVETVADILEG